MATSRFYRRRFLNRPGFQAGAYALANCHVVTGRGKNKDSSGVEADLTIADCSRVVTLELCAYSEADARNSLHKARLLRTIVNGFTDALEEAVAEVYPDLK